MTGASWSERYRNAPSAFIREVLEVELQPWQERLLTEWEAHEHPRRRVSAEVAVLPDADDSYLGGLTLGGRCGWLERWRVRRRLKARGRFV